MLVPLSRIVPVATAGLVRPRNCALRTSSGDTRWVRLASRSGAPVAVHVRLTGTFTTVVPVGVVSRTGMVAVNVAYRTDGVLWKFTSETVPEPVTTAPVQLFTCVMRSEAPDVRVGGP